MRLPKLLAVLCLLACSPAVLADVLPYQNPALPVAKRVEDLLARMSLDEKLGQMLMGGRDWVRPDQVRQLNMGTLLSGGGSVPSPNTVDGWAKMMKGYQDAAHATRLGIPVLYGIDSVHGFQLLPAATIFPQQVGLGAASDEDLMRRIGQITAREMSAAGVYWNFAPVVAVVDDIRWGRAYEALGEDTGLTSRLATAYTKGFQSGLEVFGPGVPRPIVTAKHYLGDGGVAYQSAKMPTPTGQAPIMDRGDTRGDEAALLARFLPPYKAQIDAGARSVMPSFSSWNGVKMHANGNLLTNVLRKQLGFTGLVVTDWEALQYLPAKGFGEQLALATNAGVDVFMEPSKTAEVLRLMRQNVEQNKVSEARINEAVANILRVKFEMGLFEHDGPIAEAKPLVGSPEHRAVAREAVRKSLVLLKNKGALPLKRGQHIIVAGRHANDLGLQSGGWTLEWQGFAGNNSRLPGGTTIVEGIKQIAGASAKVDYREDGDFGKSVASSGAPADVALVFVGEPPYSEWLGDRTAEGLMLSVADQRLIAKLRPLARKLVLVLVSGRPLILGEALAQSDGVVAAWLPGSEGAGVADVLFGDAPFVGKLPYGWPRDAAGFQPASAPAEARKASLLFEAGYGLSN